MAKILIYTLVFPPDQVSNAHVLANLVRGLKELGHEIKILTTTPHYQTLPEASEKQPLIPYLGRWIFKSDFEGVPCYHIKVPETKGGLLQRIWTALLFHLRSLWFGRRKEADCDIVLTVSTPPTTGLIGPIIARLHKAKSVFIVWDILSECLYHNKANLTTLVLRFIDRIAYRWNSAVVSTAPAPVEWVRSKSPRGHCVVEIPHPVDIHLYFPSPRDNEFSREHDWNGRFVICYLGNLGQFQDFSPLPDVVTACSDLNVKFICAGSGLKYEELVRTAQELGNPKWEVWGYQSPETTAMINASSDLCLVLLDSRVTKGCLPFKLLTIMASGKPVLYYGPCETDIGRLIRENELGWAIETGDVAGFVRAIREAYSDPERRARMGQNGTKLVAEKYSSQVAARQYHALIETLLAAPSTTGRM